MSLGALAFALLQYLTSPASYVNVAVLRDLGVVS